jgi:hypothetical protein
MDGIGLWLDTAYAYLICQWYPPIASQASLNAIVSQTRNRISYHFLFLIVFILLSAELID